VADHLFEHRDQRIAAFQREAFRAREFRAEVAFQAFRRGQLAQEAFFSSALKLALPATDSIRCWIQRFSSVEVMCIFRADGAAVGLLQGGNQIAQLHRVFTDGK
jgi:hypothetical protein